MKRLAIIGFILFAGLSFGRKDEYLVLSGDNRHLGNLTVTHTIDKDVEEILVESQITIKKIFTLVISYTLHSTFIGRKLVSNKITTYNNNLVKDVMSTEKRPSGYWFTKNTKENKVKDFTFCESMMYYNEPANCSEVYSEFDGVFKPLEYCKEDQHYELTNPLNNHVSKYFYKEGVLQKAIVKSTLMTLFLYRKV